MKKYLLLRRKKMRWSRWPCKAVPRHRPLFACSRFLRYVVAATQLENGVKPTFFQPFHLFLPLEKVAPAGTIGSQVCRGRRSDNSEASPSWLYH